MPKKKPREDKSRSAAGATDGTPFNAAFAGLAALRPAAPTAPTEQPPADDVPAEPSSAGGAELFPRGQKVVVRKEKKGRGGKTVTRVQGLGGDAAAIDELARGLARELGCGAQREEADILLQGHQTGRAVVALKRRGASRVVDGDAPSR